MIVQITGEISEEHVKTLSTVAHLKPLVLIDSTGGNVHCAYQLVQIIQAEGLQVLGTNIVASAAVFVLAAGSNRLLDLNAKLVMHPARYPISALGLQGDVITTPHLLALAEIAEQHKNDNVNYMKKMTSIPDEVLQRSLNQDVVFGPSDALKWGIVDEIVRVV